jgi:hypothetical protein
MFLEVFRAEILQETYLKLLEMNRDKLMEQEGKRRS